MALRPKPRLLRYGNAGVQNEACKTWQLVHNATTTSSRVRAFIIPFTILITLIIQTPDRIVIKSVSSIMGSVGETRGPPPFEPPIAVLKSQSAAIQKAIDQYEGAKTKDDKARAVSALSQASTLLSTVSTSPGDTVQRFAFQPVANGAVRVAVGMGLFNQLPIGKCATTEELASKCNSDPEFVQRIAPAVASLGFLQEVSEERYAHTDVSMILCDDTAQASLGRKFFRLFLL